MLIITVVITFLQLAAYNARPTCNIIMENKLQANPKAFLMRSEGHITEIAPDGTPYGVDCHEDK